MKAIINYVNNLEIIKKISFNYNARMDFYYQVAKLTGEGNLAFNVALREMLNMQMKGSSEQNSIKSPLYYIYNEITHKYRAGAPISVALEEYIPEADKMNISSFESSENFSKGFEELVEFNEAIRAMRNEITKATLFPVGMLVFLIGIISFFCVGIIPQITDTMDPNTPLSPVSATMVWMSRNYFLWMGILTTFIFIVASWLIWALPNFNHRFRLKLEAIPPFSLYKVNIGCAMMCALNSLSKAGMQQNEAIIKMEKYAKPYLKYRLDIISAQLKLGKSLGVALADSKLNFPEKSMVQFLAVLSKHGVLDESLERVTKNIIERGLKLVKVQARTLQLIIMLILACGIMFSFSSIYMITQDMTSAAQNSSR